VELSHFDRVGRSRDNLDFEKAVAQRELELTRGFPSVIEEFLKLRRNEANIARWAAILEDKVSYSSHDGLQDYGSRQAGRPAQL
jgi:hypothetical protein